MTALFVTRQYEFAFEKKPRGWGLWAFIPQDCLWGDDMPHDGIAWALGTYTDAKREIAQRYPKIQVWTLLSKSKPS